MLPSAKKRRCCNAGPQFNSCTIHMYFAPAPAPPPTEEAPKSLFASNAERIKRTSVMKNGKSRSVLVWQSTADGKIKAGCQNCSKKHFVDLSNFAPMDGSSRSQGARNKFDAAYAAYQQAYAAGDRDECIAQRGILEALRCTCCFDCRHDKGYVSPAASECKDYYDTMRKTMAAQHDGCQNPDCPERGEGAWCILTADHGTNPKKCDKDDELVCLGDYKKWPPLGGVPAMMEEAKQIHQWICHCCHAIDRRGGPSINGVTALFDHRYLCMLYVYQVAYGGNLIENLGSARRLKAFQQACDVSGPKFSLLCVRGSRHGHSRPLLLSLRSPSTLHVFAYFSDSLRFG